LDYELFFQAQQDFKKTELFAGQFDAFVSPHQDQLSIKGNSKGQPAAYFFVGIRKHLHRTK
jgi:hypothetical protein